MIDTHLWELSACDRLCRRWPCDVAECALKLIRVTIGLDLRQVLRNGLLAVEVVGDFEGDEVKGVMRDQPDVASNRTVITEQSPSRLIPKTKAARIAASH